MFSGNFCKYLSTKFAGATQIKILIDIPSENSHSQSMKFTVCDNGRGMTMSDLNMVGQPSLVTDLSKIPSQVNSAQVTLPNSPCISSTSTKLGNHNQWYHKGE